MISIPSNQTSHPSPPRPERRRLPVVLDETDVVVERVDPQMGEGSQIDLLRIQRRRLEDDLKLVVVLETVRVLAVPAVRGAARRLDVGNPPGLRPQDAEEGGGVKRPRPDLDIVRLLDKTSFPGPERLQGEDNVLKRQGKNLLFSEKKRGGYATSRPTECQGKDRTNVSPRNPRRPPLTHLLHRRGRVEEEPTRLDERVKRDPDDLDLASRSFRKTEGFRSAVSIHPDRPFIQRDERHQEPDRRPHKIRHVRRGLLPLAV